MTEEQAFLRIGRIWGCLGRWWRQPDQFDWLTSYLRARGLEVPTRLLMVLIAAAMTTMGMAALTLRGVPAIAVWPFSIAAVAVGSSYAVLWLRRWPTRSQSLAMICLGSVLVGVGCLLDPRPVIGLMGCTSLAITGGYAAFFHNTKAIVFNIGVALSVGAVSAARVGIVTDPVVAAAGLWLVIELNLAVPLAIQAVVRTLGADVVRSDQDPLTGVLTRRAFYERASALLTSPGNDLHLIVVMIDLDKFKKLNDLYGHVAGDQALSTVGWILREASTGSAIIGRFGGEEFILIDAVTADLAEQMPAQLCAAIAGSPQPVTASVGAAVVRWGDTAAIDYLIQCADAAMYAAKRAGGNQSRICRPSPARG